MTAGEQDSYTRLRKLLLTRISREVPGSEGILDRADDCETPRERYSVLQEALGDGDSGHHLGSGVARFRPSKGHTVEDRLWMETLTANVVVKGLRSTSPACRRTVALYAAMRAQSAEMAVPVPNLFQVRVAPPFTYFTMEYMGDDSAKAGVSMQHFKVLKEKSIAVLAAHGVEPSSCSRHLKNWCVVAARGECERRAWLIDVGNCCMATNWRPPAAKRLRS